MSNRMQCPVSMELCKLGCAPHSICNDSMLGQLWGRCDECMMIQGLHPDSCSKRVVQVRPVVSPQEVDAVIHLERIDLRRDILGLATEVLGGLLRAGLTEPVPLEGSEQVLYVDGREPYGHMPAVSGMIVFSRDPNEETLCTTQLNWVHPYTRRVHTHEHLFKALIGHCNSAGMTRIQTWVHKDNEPMLKAAAKVNWLPRYHVLNIDL